MATEYATPEEYGLADLMCCAAAREVQDNEVVFAGTGLPMVAIMLAQKTHAPKLKLIFEAGTLDGRPLKYRLPSVMPAARWGILLVRPVRRLQHRPARLRRSWLLGGCRSG